MSANNPLGGWDKVFDIAGEQQVGDRFEGECLSERTVGRSRELGVAFFKREYGPEAGTYFLRVTIANPLDPRRKLRGHVDVDRYASERDFLHAAEVTAGAVAEDAHEKWGVLFKTHEVAKLARKATVNMLHAVNNS